MYVKDIQRPAMCLQCQEFIARECHHHENNWDTHCELRNTPAGIPVLEDLEKMVQFDLIAVIFCL